MARTPSTARGPRADSRLGAVLDAAARLFAQKGYAATSMRDIALASEMLPGSLYCHFASKDELLAAVYEVGVTELRSSVQAAMERETDPWAKLEAACIAHMETLLKRSDYAQVLIRVMPDEIPPVRDRLRAFRVEYESVVRGVVAALPLPPQVDRKALRLMLLGALNWSPFWFDPQGRDSPRVLARKFVGFLMEAYRERETA